MKFQMAKNDELNSKFNGIDVIDNEDQQDIDELRQIEEQKNVSHKETKVKTKKKKLSIYQTKLVYGLSIAHVTLTFLIFVGTIVFLIMTLLRLDLMSATRRGWGPFFFHTFFIGTVLISNLGISIWYAIAISKSYVKQMQIASFILLPCSLSMLVIFCYYLGVNEATFMIYQTLNTSTGTNTQINSKYEGSYIVWELVALIASDAYKHDGFIVIDELSITFIIPKSPDDPFYGTTLGGDEYYYYMPVEWDLYGDGIAFQVDYSPAIDVTNGVTKKEANDLLWFYTLFLPKGYNAFEMSLSVDSPFHLYIYSNDSLSPTSARDTGLAIADENGWYYLGTISSFGGGTNPVNLGVFWNPADAELFFNQSIWYLSNNEYDYNDAANIAMMHSLRNIIIYTLIFGTDGTNGYNPYEYYGICPVMEFLNVWIPLDITGNGTAPYWYRGDPSGSISDSGYTVEEIWTGYTPGPGMPGSGHFWGFKNSGSGPFAIFFIFVLDDLLDLNAFGDISQLGTIEYGFNIPGVVNTKEAVEMTLIQLVNVLNPIINEATGERAFTVGLATSYLTHFVAYTISLKQFAIANDLLGYNTYTQIIISILAVIEGSVTIVFTQLLFQKEINNKVAAKLNIN